MPDDVEEIALKRLAEIDATRRELDREESELRTFLATYRKLKETSPSGGQTTSQGDEEDAHAPAPADGTSAPGMAQFPSKKYDRTQIEIAARGACLDAGRPLQRDPLLAAVQQRGIQIDGANRARNLGTIMWRLRKSFVNIRGEGYWPSDVPCPAVGYSPPRSRA
jgi:hypothetical protein